MSDRADTGARPALRPAVTGARAAAGVGRMEGSGARKPAHGGVGRMARHHYDPVTGRKLPR